MSFNVGKGYGEEGAVIITAQLLLGSASGVASAYRGAASVQEKCVFSRATSKHQTWEACWLLEMGVMT